MLPPATSSGLASRVAAEAERVARTGTTGAGVVRRHWPGRIRGDLAGTRCTGRQAHGASVRDGDPVDGTQGGSLRAPSRVSRTGGPPSFPDGGSCPGGSRRAPRGAARRCRGPATTTWGPLSAEVDDESPWTRRTLPDYPLHAVQCLAEPMIADAQPTSGAKQRSVKPSQRSYAKVGPALLAQNCSVSPHSFWLIPPSRDLYTARSRADTDCAAAPDSRGKTASSRNHPVLNGSFEAKVGAAPIARARSKRGYVT